MRKGFKMPTAYTILFSIIVVIAILTWIVPAGQYEYVDPNASKLEPIPGTYERAEQNPQGLWEVLYAPIKGFYDAMDIELFVLVIGGFLAIVMKTGAIDAGIGHVVRRLEGREKWMIPILMILFGLGGTTYGMAEETIAFYPLIIPVILAAGYDAITAVSIIALGAGLGVLGSTVNPFATGIASGFAGISIGEGIILRVIILVLAEAIGIIYVMRYAEKVRKDPSKSIVADLEKEHKKHFLGDKEKEEVLELTKRRKTVLWVFGATFIVMILGVIPWAWKFNITFFESLNNAILGIPVIGKLLGNPLPLGDWWFGEITLLFLVSSFIISKIYGMTEKEYIDSFVSGAKDLLGVALIIGVSRGITVVMNDGGMTATVLNWGEETLARLGSVAFVNLTYLFYLPMSFLVPSTSGLATLTMPIMAPLGDFAGVGRDIVITAYQSASGVINLFTPTSGVIMGALALAKVPYEKYFKHVWKLLVIVSLMIMIVMSLAVIL
ncbi:YfcC family protein [Thermohalobacter berrensis]|uniref:C4-dicarboxylate ABC transporter n=1 Tax=Thermohalobacter berrensis TaxID=99594 RepID=A0A419T6T7_9FIRM|nr:YfcC family protein [Thermohalobacter berrensis]RKD33145.1 C4-dicarboxylate ABC transporter [Thermohalobacter berrensis]